MMNYHYMISFNLQYWQVEAYFITSDKNKDKAWPESKLNHQLELIGKTKKLTDNKVYENR